VDLKSGGYLIVDQTEALTTIDVNTGGYVGARNFDDTIFKTNLEAAHAIARQLRLRNLGGIIIVDFIDMVREEHQGEVLRIPPPAGTRPRQDHGGGFSQLGLVEMTRKRTANRWPTCCASPAQPAPARAASRPRAASATRCCAKSCAKRASSIP
jgi:ribonuclease G